MVRGVVATTRYDNLSSAVKLVLCGWRREPIGGSSRCARPYLFDSAFTLAGLQGAHENQTETELKLTLRPYGRCRPA